MPDNTSGLVNPALLIAPIVLLVLIGTAGQDHLPGRARRAVPAGADLLRRAAVRRHDHRAEAADRGGVGRRRRVEVRPALHQRHPADGQQQPVDAVQVAQAGALPQLPARPAPVARRRRSWRTCPAPSWRSSPRWSCCSRPNKWLTLVAVAIMVAFHLFIISTFPLAVPLEWNVLFAYATVFLFLGLPERGTATRCADMSSPWLTVADRRGAAVLPDPGQLPAGQGVVPAVDAAVRRQLGVGGVGVRPGRRGQAEQGHPLRQEPGRPVRRLRLRAAVGRDHDAASDLRGAPCTARAAACSRCC